MLLNEVPERPSGASVPLRVRTPYRDRAASVAVGALCT
jgi:hypothetical protein